MKKSTKLAVISVAALSAMAGVSACDPGPTCEDWTVQTTIQTTFINGRASTHPVITQVCVKWEAPKAKESSK